MKGILILIGIIAVSVIFCGLLPFSVLPGMGIGMALPVVAVPGEVLAEDLFGTGFNLTNTLVGTLLADVLMLAFAFGATRNMQMVPGRLQGLFEVITDALYGVAKSTAGHNAKKIFPLMATIFLFLLFANWLELVPGVDSIGLMHCAEDGLSGYEKDGSVLVVNEALDSGERATEENYELCHAKQEGHAHADPALDAAKDAVMVAAAAELGVDKIDWKDDVGNGSSLASYVSGEGGDVEAVYAAALADAESTLAELEDAGDAMHDEEAAEGADAEAAEGAEGEAAHGPRTPETLIELALNEPFYRDDIFVVTSFVRAAATDLNLTLGLGLFAFIAIQVFGVQALGVGHFAKFINTPALANMGKNPGGLMDFVVGLLETFTELAKIISFGFRLFGNIFAGQVLLFVMTFLVSLIFPAVFYGLELFVGIIQAFVFAMLVLVFSAMAMQGHGHDEHDEEHG